MIIIQIKIKKAYHKDLKKIHRNKNNTNKKQNNNNNNNKKKRKEIGHTNNTNKNTRQQFLVYILLLYSQYANTIPTTYKVHGQNVMMHLERENLVIQNIFEFS